MQTDQNSSLKRERVIPWWFYNILVAPKGCKYNKRSRRGHYDILQVHSSSSCPAPKADPAASSPCQPCHGTGGKGALFQCALTGLFAAFSVKLADVFLADGRGYRLGLALEERQEGD